ncbi:hypothetical protein [Brachybacterium sacelli]|uniref:hypothetical protein n=1 Tax=Brachybacterium sacelli TaxID=173364 RepID=UPI003618C278
MAFTGNDYGHMGIYVGGGKIIDASGSRQQVVERSIGAPARLRLLPLIPDHRLEDVPSHDDLLDATASTGKEQDAVKEPGRHRRRAPVRRRPGRTGSPRRHPRNRSVRPARRAHRDARLMANWVRHTTSTSRRS